MNWIQNAIFEEDMMMFTPRCRFIFTLIVNLQSKMLLNQCQDLSLQIPSRLKKNFWGVLENSRTPPGNFQDPTSDSLPPGKFQDPPPGKFQDPTSHKVLDISKHHPLASFTISFSTSLREFAQTQSIVHINSLRSFSYKGPI